ncbi:hypothetical protein N9064_00470 [bacterium]|nr:hypothetical protein [bacterium]
MTLLKTEKELVDANKQLNNELYNALATLHCATPVMGEDYTEGNGIYDLVEGCLRKFEGEIRGMV